MGEPAFEGPDRRDGGDLALQVVRHGGQRPSDHGPVTRGEQPEAVLTEQPDQPPLVVQRGLA